MVVFWPPQSLKSSSFQVLPSPRWLKYLKAFNILPLCSLMLAAVTTTSQPWLHLGPSQDLEPLHFRDLKVWYTKSDCHLLAPYIFLLLPPCLLLDLLDTITPLVSLFSLKSITSLNISLPCLFCLDLSAAWKPTLSSLCHTHSDESKLCINPTICSLHPYTGLLSKPCRLVLKQFSALHPCLGSHRYCILGHLFTSMN